MASTLIESDTCTMVSLDTNFSINSDENDSSESCIDKSNSFSSKSQNNSLEDNSYENCKDSIGENECGICCKNLISPRVLSCLHVFCESCIDKTSIESEHKQLGMIIICPMCRQQTLMGDRGASQLPCDYVLTNILDMSAIKNSNVLCTSCKTIESAIARCSDCANFLCPNCKTAHEFMRCFENHEVITFEELKTSNETVPIHRPIFCKIHPSENMKFYCYSCQVPICNECIIMEHKAPQHQYERLKDAEYHQKEELYKLLNESKVQIINNENISSELGNSLNELQEQRDEVKNLILETYQSYKAILEKCKDDTLSELNKIHAGMELEIMDTFHCLEKVSQKLDCSCNFTTRLLKYGDAVEVLTLFQTVMKQFTNLIKNMPNINISTPIRFETNRENFEKITKDAFGKIYVQNIISKKSYVESSKNYSPNIVTPITNKNPVDIQNNINMPILTQTRQSPEGETNLTFFSEKNNSFAHLYSSLPSIPSCISPGPINNFTGIQDNNLQQLSNANEKVEISDKTIIGINSNNNKVSPFKFVDLLANDVNSTTHVIKNIQALAKLGNSFDMNSPTINGSNFQNMMGQSPIPLLVDTNMSTLNNNQLVNSNFQIMQSNLSTVMPQGSGDAGDMLHNITGASTFNNERSLSPSCKLSNSKLTSMQIRYKFGQLGPSKGQFNSPHGFCLGLNEDIVIADTNNHRIQIFDKNGVFKFNFGIQGKEEGQLWYPRKVAVMRQNGKFVICDRGNERSRMQIFTKSGNFVRKIGIRYIDIVAGLAVTKNNYIVAVDSVSPTVFIINDAGDLVRWFDCSEYMREPSDIAINGDEYYVCDFKGHCVVVFSEEGQFLRRIGWENMTNYPNGIDISDAGDVLIGDSHGNRFHVAVFSREGSLISEFECPYVKVSRCCGLKITSEGFIVTLAKNNHHVLVLNTLYVQ